MDTLQVGFSRVDITPQEYTTLAGYGNDAYRMCNQIVDRLYGTCIAFRDEAGKTLILCTADLLNAVKETVVDGAKKAICEATGVPEDLISVSVTHTHAGPSMYSWEDPRTNRFLTYYSKQMAKAAKEAIEDLAEAEISYGKRIVPNMTFVRHYIGNDGSYFGINYGSWKSGAKAYADVSDDQLQVLRFQRKDARDIVLVNWQCHATTTGGHHSPDFLMSSDFPGALRNHLEGLTGCHAAYFQGACGNLIPFSPIKTDLIVPERDYILYGRTMAEQAVKCMDEDMKPAKAGPIRNIHYIFSGEVDHDDDHRVPDAEKVVEHFYELDKDAQLALLRQYQFNTVHHARQTINRSLLGKTLEMDLYAYGIGDISFATTPFEMFNSNGRFVKDNTPFAITFMLAYSNGSNSYIADELAHRYDCYEVNSRRFKKGAAEEIAGKCVELLDQLKKEQ